MKAWRFRRVAVAAALAVAALLAAGWGQETEEERIKREEKEAYEARCKAFDVVQTEPGEAPGVSAWLLEQAGNVTRFGRPWAEEPPKLWFPVGEETRYEIEWGPFTVGEAFARADWVEVQGRRLLTLTMEARSNGIVESLYPVKEFMQTLIDPVTFLPLGFEKQSSEGSHKHWELTMFNHARKNGKWRSKLRLTERDFEIAEDTRDLMGLMYWIRKTPVRAGEEVTYNVMTDEKLYEMTLGDAKEDTVKLDRYGKVKCVEIEPKGKFNGMFIRKGRMWVWVSDDERYTICKVTASVPVANIRVYLTDVEGPGDDFWVTKKRKK